MEMPAFIDIVIRSYYRDARWLALSLRSVELFVRGHRRTIVVLPEASLARLDLSLLPTRPDLQIGVCRDYEDDYIGQQVTKLHADQYTDAEVIVHLDSDQIFVAPCDLRDRFFENGRVRMAYNDIGSRPRSDGWRRCASVFLRRPLMWDVTTPLPLAAPRHLYSELRRVCEELHHKQLEEYILATPADRFCEAALLRGYALAYEQDSYAWIDVSSHNILPECKTFWSRAQSLASVTRELAPILKG